MNTAFDIIRLALLRTSALTPGGTFQDCVDRAAREVISDLVESGLLKKNPASPQGLPD